MLRALFLQEFRRSWLTHASLLAVMFGTVALVERFSTLGNLLSPAEEGFLGDLLFAGLLLSGLISGERCFPAAFKEGRYTFLLTLPRPRGGIWLAYLGGRLIGASLAVMPVLLLTGWLLLLRLRGLAPESWLFFMLAPEIGLFSMAALTVYLVYFLGSAALALVFRKEVLTYLVGLPLLTGLLAQLAYIASYGFVPSSPAALQESSLYLRTFSCGSLLLAMVWAIVSLRTFCRGEPHLGRRTARTLVEAGLASAALVGLGLIAAGSSSLAAISGPWRPATPQSTWFPYETGSRPVSADGRFLFIQQEIQERPLFTRLAVVDLQSGVAARWMVRPGIYQVSWSATEAVLNVLIADDTLAECLGVPCKPFSSWYRLSPDLQVLSIRKFPGTGFIRQLGSGLLLVTRQRETGRIYRLSDRDGSFSEILTSELDDVAHAWSLDGGAVVVFPTTASLLAWWLDPQGRVIHKDSVKRRLNQPFHIVGRRILFHDEVLAESRQRDFPTQSDKLENWDRLLPDTGGPLDSGAGELYFERSTKTSSIWWHDVEHGTWTRTPVELSFAEFAKMRLGSLYSDQPSTFGIYYGLVDFDSRTGILATAFASKGRSQLILYDGRVGRSIPATVACESNQRGATSLQQVQGLEMPLVSFICWDQTDFRSYRLLEVFQASGRAKELSWHSSIDQSGSLSHWIYLNPEGASVWVSTTGEIWQAGPGRKRLRLNPPAR